jgi:hypothetical protein
MNKGNVLALFLLAMLAVAQTSLAPHLALFRYPWFEWVNFVDVAVVVIAVFEKRSRRFSWIAAVLGGFFLDLYSTRFFGIWILAMLAAVAFIKLTLKKYVRIPSFW